MPALFSAFAAWLIGALDLLVTYSARYLIARVILSFGIGIITITGVSAGISSLESLVSTNISGSTNVWVTSLLGMMGFDSFVNIIFSAYVAKLAFMGLQQGGSISRMIVKGQE